MKSMWKLPLCKKLCLKVSLPCIWYNLIFMIMNYKVDCIHFLIWLAGSFEPNKGHFFLTANIFCILWVFSFFSFTLQECYFYYIISIHVIVEYCRNEQRSSLHLNTLSFKGSHQNALTDSLPDMCACVYRYEHKHSVLQHVLIQTPVFIFL